MTALLYRDPSASVDERVHDLVARMTPEEKIAQLTSAMTLELWVRTGSTTPT